MMLNSNPARNAAPIALPKDHCEPSSPAEEISSGGGISLMAGAVAGAVEGAVVEAVERSPSAGGAASVGALAAGAASASFRSLNYSSSAGVTASSLPTTFVTISNFELSGGKQSWSSQIWYRSRPVIFVSPGGASGFTSIGR